METEGTPSPDKAVHIICFHTGLDPRSFARTKMSQCLTEQGYVVSSDGTHEIWKPAGVKEIDGFMKVWGPMFSGTRLDLLLENINSGAEDSAKQIALNAVVSWIKAKMFLGETNTALNPSSSFILEDKVFFAPENLSNRCLYIERKESEAQAAITSSRSAAEVSLAHIDRYNCPDLSGLNAAAFCAGVMLYEILTGSHPYPTAEIYQDMREGIFMPVNLAAPDMDEKLSGLIQEALILPKQVLKTGADILKEILEILVNTDISSLFITLPEDKKIQIEKEKQLYLVKRKSITGTKRFVTRNKQFLTIAGIGFFIILFITISAVRGISQRPTTAGLSSGDVITAYYDAFASLDHMFMEACIKGADKSDINVAASYFAVSRARQAYEYRATPAIVSVKEWQEQGGELPARDVFGVTDLMIEYVSGSEYDGIIVYNAEYQLWAPDELSETRKDTLTLKQDRRKNWRITEISRTWR